MKLITDKDLKVFEKCEELEKQYMEAKKIWLDEVRKSDRGEVKYSQTKPLFDEYIEKANNFNKYFLNNRSVLFASRYK